jgi:hypothetical protein
MEITHAEDLLPTDLTQEPASEHLRSRLHRLLRPGELPKAELVIRSPLRGIYLVTSHRLLFIIDERIGYRMGCVPNEGIKHVEHIRQRSTNIVHILHASGKLLLTSVNEHAIRRFVAALAEARSATAAVRNRSALAGG